MQKYIILAVLAICLLATCASTGSEKGIQVVDIYRRNVNSTVTKRNVVDDYAQILEDTDIMAKIIDRALEKKWPRKYEPSTLFRQSLGCQGVYLKDYGFVFMTNINFPVAKRAEPKQERPPTDDLWQQTKRELKGTHADRYEVQLEHVVNYNTARVSLLKEELLTLIGEYGTRLRQLNEEKSVVVVVVRGTPLRNPDTKLEVWFRLDGKADQSEQKVEIIDASEQDYKMPHIAYQVKEPSNVKVRIFGANGSVVRTIDMGHHDGSSNEVNTPLPWNGKNEAGKKVKPGSYTYELKVGNANDAYAGSFVLRRSRSTPDGPWVVVDAPTIGRAPYEHQLLNTLYSPKPAISAGRTTLIVKVSRKDIASYKDGSLDFEEFAKKAEITQY